MNSLTGHYLSALSLKWNRKSLSPSSAAAARQLQRRQQLSQGQCRAPVNGQSLALALLGKLASARCRSHFATGEGAVERASWTSSNCTASLNQFTCTRARAPPMSSARALLLLNQPPRQAAANSSEVGRRHPSSGGSFGRQSRHWQTSRACVANGPASPGWCWLGELPSKLGERDESIEPMRDDRATISRSPDRLMMNACASSPGHTARPPASFYRIVVSLRRAGRAASRLGTARLRGQWRPAVACVVVAGLVP